MFTGDVEFKEIFLKELEENYTNETDATRRQAEILFNSDVLKLYENIYAKDLYNFTPEEVKTFLSGMRKTNVDTLATEYSRVKKYLLHAQSKKMGVQNVNPAVNLTREDLKELVHEEGEEEKYFTKEELKNTITQKDSNGRDLIELDQDKAIYIMIYNGILGKDCEDLVRFKKKDFKYHEMALLFNENRIKLEEWERDIIQDAIDEKSFLESGKNYSSKSETKSLEYIEDVFLIKRRKIKSKRDFSDYKKPVNKQTIMKKLRVCSRTINKPFWTSKNIYAAGIVYRMLEIKKDWKLAEVQEYKDKNNIPVHTQRLLRGIRILKTKLESENTKKEIAYSIEK